MSAKAGEESFRPLSAIALQDRAEFGGKAARLGEALRLGCPVLPGAALSTALYHALMRQGGLHGEIASILTTMQPSTTAQCQAAEWAIHAAFAVRRVPDAVADAVRQAWASLGGGPVMVRSSATTGDAPQHSFVGQHASFANVATADEALQAVLGCWQSLFSARAIQYARRFHVDLLGAAMGVLLQPMATFTARGALFTVDPVSGDADVFVLEVQEGPEAGVHLLEPFQRLPGEHALWGELRTLGLRLDEHLHSYQTLEWGLSEGALWLLRVRPVTGAPSHLPLGEREIGPEALDLVLPADVSPRTAEPLTWYHRSRQPALDVAEFREAQRVFAPYAGRVARFCSGYLYARPRRHAIGGEPAGGPLGRFVFQARRLLAARQLDRPFRALWRERRAHLGTMLAVRLGDLSLPELASLLREAAAQHEAFWAERGRLGDSARVLAGLLQQLHAQWLGGDPARCREMLWIADDQVTRAREGLCDLVRRTHSDEVAFQGWLAAHRHLYLADDPLALATDLASVRVDVARAQAEREHWARDAGLPLREQHAQGRERRVAAERALLAPLGGLQRALYRHLLRLARRYARDAVDAQEPVWLARLMESEIVAELGRRLAAEGMVTAPDQAALLGYEELLDWLAAPAERDGVVRALNERAELVRRWRRYTPPLTLGEPNPAADDPAEPDLAPLQGRPISHGYAIGRARVISNLGEAANVLPGEILVCPEARYEYGPLFGVVAAVVAERGSLLDHVSVLAREYGVPTVFGVPDLVQQVRTGDELVVRATEGLVLRRTHPSDWETW